MTAARKWDQEFDVVVAGSGGAGLTAAILAHDNGARVLVLERSDKVGGTTAVSGGVVWAPMNDHMQEHEVSDSREEALAYCKHLTMGSSPDELVETFVDTAPRMLRYLEEHTPARFSVWTTPDYYGDDPGGKACGRSLEPELFSKKELGEWADRLRPAPQLMLPLTLQEAFVELRLLTNMKNLPAELVVRRIQEGYVACGNALAGRLFKGCLDRGIRVALETRALELVRENGRLAGLRAERHGRDFLVKARAVVLACGGFEWNEGLKTSFLAGPLTHPNSPPFNEGDGLVMAMEAGARLGNMTGAWWEPSGAIPGEEYEGRQLSRFIAAERSAPHAIMVNRFGERFVGEGVPYNDLGRVLHQFDPTTYSYRNLPCWTVFDSQYRRKYPLMTVLPGDPDPDWLAREESLEGLARRVGIDAKRLAATVTRWNGFVREGRDADFGRGERMFERASGAGGTGDPVLGTVEEPPFYAMPVYPGALGTAGGPQTNSRGQVLGLRGDVVPGLYGAGNVIASPTGTGYYGAGGTLGPALTWGYICGINAAREAAGRAERREVSGD